MYIGKKPFLPPPQKKNKFIMLQWWLDLSFYQNYFYFSGTLFQGETIWPKSFDQKGLILVKYKDSDPLSCMPKEELYKLGVESFLREPDIEGVDYWKVTSFFVLFLALCLFLKKK